MPTASASASRPRSVSHCSRSSVSGFATISQPNGSVPLTSCTGWAAAISRRLSPGGVKLTMTCRSRSSFAAAERGPGEPRQAEPLSGEERRADVVELVAGRELELLGRELRRLRALVRRADRGLRIERGEARGLTAELGDRLVVRDVLEQPHRERDRHQAEHEHDREEEGGQPEPERSQHEAQGRPLRGRRGHLRPRARWCDPRRPCSPRPTR